MTISASVASAFLTSRQINEFDLVVSNTPTIYQVTFNLAQYQPEYFTRHNITFPRSLSHAVKKRQAEFLAGRYAASLTLRALGYDDFQVSIGENRQPVWPVHIVGSITHTHNTAFCVALRKSEADYIGIDFENHLKSGSIHEIKDSIINQNENMRLSRCEMHFEKAFTLTFSAKESLFKALYPQVGYYFDFTDAEIINISTSEKSFELMLKKTLTDDLTAGTIFRGHFIEYTDSILTLVAPSAY